jgi:formate hydrogenlyase transcriptional activator
MVEQKTFRAELYYRLSVFPISLPPLRERKEDIPSLVNHFMWRFSRHLGKAIDQVPGDVMETLKAHHWPGNIRELQNFIERSVILSDGTVLCSPVAELEQSAGAESLGATTLHDAERDHILKILKQARWVVAGPSGAAARLGIKRSTLYFRMQKLGISRFSNQQLPA